MYNNYYNIRNNNVPSTRNYVVIAKYNSKYGKILYCVEAKEEPDNIDFNNVYVHTLYYKGRDEIKVNELYEFSTLKGENGLMYCF